MKILNIACILLYNIAITEIEVSCLIWVTWQFLQQSHEFININIIFMLEFKQLNCLYIFFYVTLKLANY